MSGPDGSGLGGDPAALLPAQAEALRGRRIPAVTDKRPTAHSPSGDLHDYVSIGTYWWPAPETIDGLPYVRRDGLVSPDFALYDRPRWDEAAASIVIAAHAAVHLDDAVSADEAVQRVRHWFLAPATRMTPHLRHAQMIPGRCTGRPEGIIDFAIYLPPVLDHVGLLAALPYSPWTSADQRGLAAWCAALLDWLETDELARREQAAANNHGTWFDRLVVALALFNGEGARAVECLNGVRKRISEQIEPDGRMPAELGRTCSFGYCLMNLRGFVELAELGRPLGVELWRWADAAGRALPAGVAFLYRHAVSREPWPYEQAEPIDWRMAALLFQRANGLGGAYPLAALAHRLPAAFDAESFALVEPVHPFGRERSFDPGAPVR